MKEIKYEDLVKLPEDSYVLIDIRDEGLRAYGMIPGAEAIDFTLDENIIKENIDLIPKDKTLVFYCEIGRKTKELDNEYYLYDRICLGLEGGYIGYVKASMAKDEGPKERQHKAEESIRKKFHKPLFTPFAKACKTYKLIEEGDRIAVCISGGKLS